MRKPAPTSLPDPRPGDKRAPTLLPDPVSGVTSEEIAAVCRLLDECARVITTGRRPMYLVGVIRMVEEDLQRRRGSGLADEILRARGGLPPTLRPQARPLGAA
jgi:hypothetical protein